MTHWHEQLLAFRNLEYLAQQGEINAASRRMMVERVNANQRLEGYEPDEHLKQLQEQFIAGTLTTTEMVRLLTDYGLTMSHQEKK
ncbi:antitoxin VbhA family protein [Agrobacterium tumefaciens]|jgi:uncharacterized protein YdgA (DUF945 family)|uniref:antitoxin VbhA family protein n=1 Tax=Agrobacterium tumefaciens TaxID=358 RepID=UPI00157384D8|nr:antitoxin VbhA family protein [Agrobacterium tumefaciens]NTB05835.1 antitoxin VbhA family protein [Agrobacterium tumefaciens]